MDKVITGLNAMETEIVLSEKVAPENMEAFIRVVKYFIRYDLSNDYYLEFSSDFKKLRKLLKPNKTSTF
jgi:hypothetical protein